MFSTDQHFPPYLPLPLPSPLFFLIDGHGIYFLCTILPSDILPGIILLHPRLKMFLHQETVLYYCTVCSEWLEWLAIRYFKNGTYKQSSFHQLTLQAFHDHSTCWHEAETLTQGSRTKVEPSLQLKFTSKFLLLPIETGARFLIIWD